MHPCISFSLYFKYIEVLFMKIYISLSVFYLFLSLQCMFCSMLQLYNLIHLPKKIRERNKPILFPYGLKDNQGQHINNGSEITSENNTINVSLSFIHNIDEDRKYGLNCSRRLRTKNLSK